MKRKQALASELLIALIILVSCTTPTQQLLDTKESQVKLRAIQTRAFDTTEKEKMLRTVIVTLQDLGFVMERADYTLGTVSATKLGRHPLQMMVSVRPLGETQLLVKANVQYNLYAVEDPEPYQQFFDSLSKAIFLTAHQVD